LRNFYDYFGCQKIYACIDNELELFDAKKDNILTAEKRLFDSTAGEQWIQQLSVDHKEFHNLFRQLAESQNRYDLSYWEPDMGLLSQS